MDAADDESSITSPELICTVTEADVVCGRDKSSYNHAGNKRFRECVAASVVSYQNAETKFEKTLQVLTTIKSIRSNGGRFLKADAKTGGWYELSEDIVRDKVGRAIRDVISFQKGTKKLQQTNKLSSSAAAKKQAHNKRKAPSKTDPGHKTACTPQTQTQTEHLGNDSIVRTAPENMFLSHSEQTNTTLLEEQQQQKHSRSNGAPLTQRPQCPELAACALLQQNSKLNSNEASSGAQWQQQQSRDSGIEVVRSTVPVIGPSRHEKTLTEHGASEPLRRTHVSDGDWGQRRHQTAPVESSRNRIVQAATLDSSSLLGPRPEEASSLSGTWAEAGQSSTAAAAAAAIRSPNQQRTGAVMPNQQIPRDLSATPSSSPAASRRSLELGVCGFAGQRRPLLFSGGDPNRRFEAKAGRQDLLGQLQDSARRENVANVFAKENPHLKAKVTPDLETLQQQLLEGNSAHKILIRRALNDILRVATKPHTLAVPHPQGETAATLRKVGGAVIAAGRGVPRAAVPGKRMPEASHSRQGPGDFIAQTPGTTTTRQNPEAATTTKKQKTDAPHPNPQRPGDLLTLAQAACGREMSSAAFGQQQPMIMQYADDHRQRLEAAVAAAAGSDLRLPRQFQNGAVRTEQQHSMNNSGRAVPLLNAWPRKTLLGRARWDGFVRPAPREPALPSPEPAGSGAGTAENILKAMARKHIPEESIPPKTKTPSDLPIQPLGGLVPVPCERSGAAGVENLPTTTCRSTKAEVVCPDQLMPLQVDRNAGLDDPRSSLAGWKVVASNF